MIQFISTALLDHPAVRAAIMGLTFLIAQPTSASAQQARTTANPVYSIANFEVWAEAKNAVAAKKTALEDGRQFAFEALLKRLTVYTPNRRFPKLSDKDIARLITSLSIKDERNSKTEYLANIDFKFSEPAVKKMLVSHGLTYWDKQAEPVMIIPVVHQSLLTPKAGELNSILSQEDWVTSWKTLDLGGALVPLRLKERLAIIDDAVLTALLKDDNAARQGLLKAYNNERVVLALLTTSPAKGKVRFTLVGRDGIGDLIYKKDQVVSNEDYVQMADMAAEVALGLLESRLKFTKRSTALGHVTRRKEVLPWQTELQEAAPITGWQGQARGERVVMEAQFQGLRHWQSILRRLRTIEGLEDLKIDKLSARAAEISFDFPGGADALAPALREKGLNLERAGGGWSLFEG